MRFGVRRIFLDLIDSLDFVDVHWFPWIYIAVDLLFDSMAFIKCHSPSKRSFRGPGCISTIETQVLCSRQRLCVGTVAVSSPPPVAPHCSRLLLVPPR